jgi:cell wall-associated NlpC family hydrolase
VADEFSQSGVSQTKLLNDVLLGLNKLEPVFQKINELTKSTKTNLQGWGGLLGGITGGGGGGNSVAAGGGTYSGGFNTGAAGMVGSAIGAVGSLAVGLGASAASAMPTVQTAVSSQLLTSQAKFSGMQGNVNATVKSLMGLGTTSSATDVQQAIAMGSSSGLLPGLAGYNSQIMPGVMQLSNLTGSAQSGMQAAAALNSGQSVNTLRMMGIQVRGSNGAMRNPASIFQDIYNFAVSQSGGRLNKSNIAIALQPGNGLANLLDAASAGDPVLRDALQKAALQFSQGGDLSKGSLTQTGQLTAAVNSQSALNQSTFGLVAASQRPEAQGFVEANKLLSSATNQLASLVTSSASAAWALTQLAKAETGLSNPVGKGVASAGASIFGFAKKALGIGLMAVGTLAEIPSAGLSTGLILGGAALAGSGGSGLGHGATTTTDTTNRTSGIQSTASASLVLQTGASLSGIPYSWGGGSIGGPTRGTSQGSNTVGFDCSSFVQYVFAKAGVMLPRTTYAQINCGTPIEPTQAQPGDLLFFGDAQAPHHVAIYIGNGRLIQAPQTGGVVGTASVNLRGVAACRRLINGSTGTALNNNLLTKTHRSVTSMPGNLGHILSGFTNNTMSGSLPSNIFMNDLMGYNPSQAMSGGVVGGTGLGQGSTEGANSNISTNMAQQYLYTNSKTGTLEVSNTAGGTVIHYGGVTIPINLPNGAKIDEQALAILIKKEINSIGIRAKVANS